ncbi:hypothetical protein P7K49_012721 [Saguinus oedipus]|uniref:Uncharacterized protein n=1 Tax=Saguinus oedipus TaxID=9490 RepID=A0ABQ9VEH0_SAGOE|nr:hypothetical protein P7K49_012721 [Saguinus oedipus]
MEHQAQEVAQLSAPKVTGAPSIGGLHWTPADGTELGVVKLGSAWSNALERTAPKVNKRCSFKSGKVLF